LSRTDSQAGIPSRYNVTTHPPGVFAAITDITKLTGLFGQRCTP
jgi:hypothetical protein